MHGVSAWGWRRLYEWSSAQYVYRNVKQASNVHYLEDGRSTVQSGSSSLSCALYVGKCFHYTWLWRCVPLDFPPSTFQHKVTGAWFPKITIILEPLSSCSKSSGWDGRRIYQTSHIFPSQDVHHRRVQFMIWSGSGCVQLEIRTVQ